MGSESRLRGTVVLCSAALTGCALAAVEAGTQPRLLVLWALAGALCMRIGWRALCALGQCNSALAMPAPTSDALAAQAAHLQLLEMRFEHAPIAMFSVALPGNQVEPLNANARRVLAPGRTSAPDVLRACLAAQPLGQRSLISFDTERGAERALVAVCALSAGGVQQHLLSMMPVESELEAEAMNAWRELVHVLTHEIMNSLTPVASLSHSANDIVGDVAGQIDATAHADLSMALDAITRRADSLLDFVAAYRSLANTPPPQPQRVRLETIFNRLSTLLNPAWRARGGNIEFHVEPATLELLIDAGQFEQALINLLKNSAEATLGRTPALASVRARLVRGARLRIDIADNGPGVPPALIAHIFTPFFSTKERGGGIGLALVRQLIHGNGGTVRYARSGHDGACFVVVF